MGKKLKYIVFGLSDDFKEIIVKKHSAESSYDEFLKDLPEDACRWAVYDFAFENDGKRNKLCFFSWSVAPASCECSLVLIHSAQGLPMAPKSGPRWCSRPHE